jgi:Uma2 family endonuclease
MSISHRPEPATVRRQAETTALLVPRRSGLRVSDRVFWRLCQDNPGLRLERTARGELIVIAPAGMESGRQNADISGQLWVWTRATGAGVSFDSSAGFQLPNGATRSPDASWLVRERWEALRPEDRLRFGPICPDFVVELMSPTDTREETREKLREYIEQGARLGWLIDPEAREVEIYRPGQPVETLRSPKTLSGESVLPGFVLDLEAILGD